jgi:gliding motility-associated-like protein
MSIVVTTLPNATIGGTNSLCQNSTPPNVVFTGSNSTAPYTFTYNINGGASQTITTTGTSSTVSVSVPTAIPGVYNYNISSVSVGSCTNTLSSNNTAIITVFENPTILMPDQTICGGNPITINPNVTPSGGQYLWTGPLVNNLTSNSITVSPANNSTYSLNYTLNGCSTNQSVSITVIQNPTATVSPQTICFGDTVVLVAGPNGATYSWTGNNIIGPTNLQQIQVNPTSTTTYTITTQIGGCAVSTATATVTVNPIPTVDASPESQSICNGQIASISSTVNPGGGNYQWQGSTVNGQTTPTISVSPVLINPLVTDTFNYILTYSVNGCTGVKDTVAVIVKPKPVVSVNDLTICSGTSDTIEANPNLVGGQYNWSFNNSTILSGNTDSLLIVSPLANPIDQITNYYYDSWYILNGCSSDTVISHVTVNPIPTVTVNDATICAGFSAPLTAVPSSTGGTFAWTGPTISGSPLTTQSISVSPNLTNPELSQNLVYNVSYTDLGCTSFSVPANVTVNPTPSINPINITICSGGTFDTIPNTLIAGNNIPANTTYTWTYADNPDILNEANNSVSSTNISGGPLTSNTNVTTSVNYTITPTSGTSGNCVGTPFNMNVTITATPSIANKVDSICSGSFPVLDFVPADVVPPGTQYSWVILFDNPLISGQSNQTTLVSDFSNQVLLNNDVNAQPQTLTYLVTPTSGPCPGATFQLQVTVLPAPILADGNITICSDDNVTSYTFGTPGDIIPIGTEYTWVVLPNSTITGQTSNAVPASTFSTGILHNSTNVNQTLHYVVTPIASALNPPCSGAPFDLYVMVQPTPVLQNVTLSAICSGTSFSYTPVNASPTTIWPAQNAGFTWVVGVNNNVTGQSSNPSNPEMILSQTLTNLTNVIQNVVYTITPYDTITGCTGSTYTVTVPVSPRPVIPNQLASVCSGQAFVSPLINAAPAVIIPVGTTYTWPTPIANPSGSISGGSSGTNLTTISQTLTNINSIICDTLTYVIVPSYGSAPGLVCVGNPFELNVRVKPVPNVAIQATSALICPNTCVQLTAVPSLTTDCNGNSGSYSWSPQGSLTPNPAVTDVVTACPLGNTTYSVVYTFDGCSAIASQTINIVSPPNVGSISAIEQTICEGGCTVLTANIQNQSVVPTYVEWSNGDVDYTSPFTTVVCPSATTTYSATAYLAGCFGSSASTTVNVNLDPIITAQPTPDTTICVGGTYPLSVTLQYGAGTANYQWYISTDGSNIGGIPLPNASGTIVTNTTGYTVLLSPPNFNIPGTYTYYCIITYGPNGCGVLTSAAANIHVVADPVVSILPNTTQTMCIGGAPTCLDASVSGGIGSNFYLWNPGGASSSTFCPPSDSVGTFSYTVIVSQTGIACASLPSNSVVINIVPDPVITINGAIEVCEGAEVPLSTSISGGIGNITSYTWNQSQPVGSPYILMMSWNGSGGITEPIFEDIIYQVEITQEGNGCNAVDTHFINVVADPVVSVNFDPLICVNTSTELVASFTGGTGTASFDWYEVDSLLTVGGVPIPTDGPSDNSITQTIYESYYNFFYVALEMTGLGCNPDTSDLIIIEALDWAIADFDVIPDSLEQSFFDPTFSFINQSQFATNYVWDLDECEIQLSNTQLYQIPTPFYNPNAEDIIDYTYGCPPGVYTVQLIAYNQGICPDTAFQQIRINDELVVYVPNTFTPNDDNMNDLFVPVVTSNWELAEYDFKIYDRWGEVVFQSDQRGEGWDGIAGRPWPGTIGTEYPDNIKIGDPYGQRPVIGTYVWTLKVRLMNSTEKKEYRGHVNLVK